MNQKILVCMALFVYYFILFFYTYIIKSLGNSIRAKTCTGIAEKCSICNECRAIKYNKILCNRIAKPLPSSENIKFTPKHYWDDNPLKRYLQNIDLRDIWNVLNYDCNSQNKNFNSNPWITLADKAIKGSFQDAPVFTGLCEVMSDAAERKFKNQTKKNMKYSEEFTNFLVILGGFSIRALDLFRQNLEGRSIQSIRYLF